MAAVATKCHYEILQVNRDVDETGLKKAYRKLALKWHPDKNPDRVEECTQVFAVIQKAYDVLSDPQERAWYDRHREAIIRGGFGDDYQDDFINIMAYFSSSAYTAFDDSEKGFYSVYADVFCKIAEEDKRFKEPEDSDYDVPGFGNSKSDYEEVVQPFYNYWQSYFTSRSFVWVEEYNTREAENRRIAKLMEKDNKKKRDAARKEWNEEVRQLVMFVKKRDKRALARKKEMEAKAAELARLNAERIETQRIERAKKVHEYAKKGQKVMKDLEANFQELERHMAAEFGDSLSEESADDDTDEASECSSSDIDDLYCVACNKSFRSQKAFQNHANSKKHRENVAIITQELEDDEDMMKADLSREGEGSAKSGDEGIIGDEGAEEEVEEEQKQKLSKKQKKKRRQQKKMQSALEEEENEDENPTDADPADISEHLAEKLSLDSRELPSRENGDLETVEDVNDGNERAPTAVAGMTGAENSARTDGTEENIRKPKARNKKNKGNQPPAQSAAAPSQDVLHCNVCQHEFPTRNKLFNHIKTTGHALRVTGGPPTDTQTGGKKGKRKGKKGRGKVDGLE